MQTALQPRHRAPAVPLLQWEATARYPSPTPQKAVPLQHRALLGRPVRLPTVGLRRPLPPTVRPLGMPTEPGQQLLRLQMERGVLLPTERQPRRRTGRTAPRPRARRAARALVQLRIPTERSASQTQPPTMEPQPRLRVRGVGVGATAASSNGATSQGATGPGPAGTGPGSTSQAAGAQAEADPDASVNGISTPAGGGAAAGATVGAQ